jgi:type IV secretory pathway TrbF-like protein
MMHSSYFAPEGSNATAFRTGPDNMEIANTFNGLQRKNARMWQIIALASLSSFLISLGILGYAVSLPKEIPVIVAVDTEGKSTYVGRVDKKYTGSHSVPDAAKTYVMKRLLHGMHTWLMDSEAQQALITETQHLVQGGAIKQLDLFYRGNNPFDRLGELSRSVSIEPPLKQTANTWIVHFTTTERSRIGIDGKLRNEVSSNAGAPFSTSRKALKPLKLTRWACILPILTLRSFRNEEEKLRFGDNCVHRAILCPPLLYFGLRDSRYGKGR